MNGKGIAALIVISILVLMVSSTFSGTPTLAAEDKALEPSAVTPINFPAFPTSGGPYITQVTVRPPAVTGAPAGEDEIYVVFNEDIVGPVDLDAFIFNGFDVDPVSVPVVGTNWVSIPKASNVDPGTDSIALAEAGAITAADGSESKDLSPFPIGQGPVIIDMAVLNYENADPTDDQITITFDADVEFGAGDDAELAFGSTPEFNGASVDFNQLLGNDTMTIFQGAPGPPDFNLIRPGVTMIHLDANRIRWVALDEENSVSRRIAIPDMGPHVVSAYYDTTGVNPEMTLVMSKPVDFPAAILGLENYFDLDPDGGGAWDAVTGSIVEVSGGGFSAVFKAVFDASTTDPTEGADTIADLGVLVDYQAQTGTPNEVPITIGPGIIHASYDDGQTPSSSDVTDDRLYIWVNEDVEDLSLDPSTDLDFIGFDGSKVQYVTGSKLVDGAFVRLTFSFESDADDSQLPGPGARVVPTAGNSLVGVNSGLALVDETRTDAITIQDESRPYQLQLVDVDATDVWNDALLRDEITVTWLETGTDDSDQYYLVLASGLEVIDDDFLSDNIQNCIGLGNVQPQVVDGTYTVRFFLVPGVTLPINGGVPFEVGDPFQILIAAADLTGNLARPSDIPSGYPAFIAGGFLAGPLCPARDFINLSSIPAEADTSLWDDDVIHVVGTPAGGGIEHYVYGDAGAIGCQSDHVWVFDGPDPMSDTPLGTEVAVNPDGSFDPIDIGSPDLGCIYVFNEQDGDFSQGTPITFDYEYPTIDSDPATPYADFIFDPWNPYRIYNQGDYVNIRLRALDPVPVDACYPPLIGGPDPKNPLFHIWADFTGLDSTPGNISGFGTPADSIEFTSLGADLVDNDGDWTPYTDVNDNGSWDPGEPLNDDKGLDGLGPGDPGYVAPDEGEGDGLPTFGDPFVDENGNGSFDPGETFLNLFVEADGSPADLLWDPGEPNLDSQDPDEIGWYELSSNGAMTRGTVRQGYELANPIPEAMLNPFTAIVLHIEDNGIDGNELVASVDRSLPFVDAINDNNRTLNHITTYDGGDPERRFVASLDVRPPTIGEITYLATEPGAGADGAPNLIAPGSPTYHLGRYVDFTSTSLSDDDVLYTRARIRTGPGTGDWEDLALDPGPASGGESDANGDLYPGARGYDEDDDAVATQSNGIDDDEDGVVDESDEGIDFSDREVNAADQDAAADAAATYGNGLDCENDYTDNDNDAFFVYDSYAGGGLAGTENIGKIHWYNIDEGDNGFDDDNDGVVDNEDPESEGYDPTYDDNEDGIADGEAVMVPINTAFSTLAIADPPSADYGPPIPGPGVNPNFIRVDAAHVLGVRPPDGPDAENTPFYYNELAYGEVVSPAFEVLTPSVRTFASDGYDLDADPDSSATMVFNWHDGHGGSNLDFGLISAVYGLTADGVTEYQLREVAADKSGNLREVWSEPISFTLDLTAPVATITGCGSGGSPVDFADVRPADPDIQIYDAGKHPQDYTLTADADEDAIKVTFQGSFDPDFGSIDFESVDETAPFTAEWPGGGMYTVNNYPAANADSVYFRVFAEDAFGNAQDPDSSCVFWVSVIDGTEPTITITQIHNDGDLQDGTCVPPDSSISIFADVYDNDQDLNGNPLGWVGGLDVAPGDAGVDDDDDGLTDEDDVDGDGIFTAGIDNAGPDGIPGTNDDEWNGANEDPTYMGGGQVNNLTETDDYITNDVVQVVFEYNPVNDVPDLGWLPIETVHGDTFSTGGQTVDWTQPAVATWNTVNLPTGDYNLRAYGCDFEGNCDSLTAFLTTVCIRAEPLRAYIQPEVCTGGSNFDLYAIHYIHDYEIDKVRFEYWFDENGDNCATADDSPGVWVPIATDDLNSPDPRGDAVLYKPSAERLAQLGMIPDAIQDLVYVEALSGTQYKFWDPEGDGYSPRDPVIWDDNNNGIFDDGDEVVIGDDGDVPEGAALSAFADDEFYAEAASDGGDGLDDTDWIFRENQLNGTNGELNLWHVSWDATGQVNGNYLVRAIAIDETNQEDVLAYNCYDPAAQNPEEIESVTIDTEEPDAHFTSITLPDGGTIDLETATEQPYIPGVSKWMKICAAGSPDLARVLFEYSLDGGVSWTPLDVNNDDDFYSNMDDEQGFQADGADEIFNDLNGNFIYDGPGVDFVRYDGGDGVDTPIGWPLLPLVGEDPINDNDDDLDGVVDEDPLVGDPALGQPGSPQDYQAPFCVYLDIADLPLWADVNVLFRATGSDFVCNGYREDPDPDVFAVIIGENTAPEADIIRAEDQDGNEIDVFPPVMDDSPVATIGASTDTMRVFATAEDITAIREVDLYYRFDPNCYSDLTFEERQWESMSLAGWAQPDSVYPYDFDVLTDMIPDGAYQMYARAEDAGGNYTLPPANPWAFKKFADAGEDFAYVSSPEPPPAAPDEAAVGDEYTILGQLADPSQQDIVAVQFWFAPRVLDEMIDASAIQPLAPYVSQPLDQALLSEFGSCDGVVLTINGELGTCHEDLSTVAAPTELDYMYDADNNAIIFGARPAGDDEILISYNFNNWVQIVSGDEFAPYSVAWSAADGGVPDPSSIGADPAATDAYDLIAIARFDLNDDGEYGDIGCDYDEPKASEGNHLLLRDTDRPLVMIWGLAYSDIDPLHQGPYPDWNRPGNPLFSCGDDLGGPDNAFILSGKEADVFVTAADQGGGSIDSVSLAITSQDPETGATSENSWDMTLYDDPATTIDLPITFYPTDYPQWSPDDIENVVLKISTDGGATFPISDEMTEGTESWQATARLFIGTNHRYEFEVDLVGDTQARILDPRNNNGVYSALNVPATPFWYLNLDNDTDLYKARVHRVVATATDDSGNTGNNLNSGTPGTPETPQGPVVFWLDQDPPVVQSIWAMNDSDQPLVGTRVSPTRDYHIWAQVSDFPFTDFNVLTVNYVRFQYSPDGNSWVDIDTDSNPTDGGWWADWTPPDPSSDGYDNDGDGLYDEDDERIADVTIRAVAGDCGRNNGWSDQQDPAVVLALTIDAAEPSACPSEPVDGQVFAYTDPITISGTATGDWLPAQGSDDIAKMWFEVKYNNYYWVDENGNGWYDNGTDEVWEDSNHNGAYDPGAPAPGGADQIVRYGADGIFSDLEGPAHFWFTLDPTPQDSTDPPYLTEPTNGDAYSMTWSPLGSDFIEGQLDEYVRVRMVAEDTAGNIDGADDGYAPCEKLIILNDTSAQNPRAYVMSVDDEWVDPVECLVIGGSGNVMVGGTVSSLDDVSSIRLYMMSGGVTTLIGIATPTDKVGYGEWTVPWDTESLAQGSYTLFATTVDFDQNESSAEEATRICVTIDREGPGVDYTNWVNAVEYTDDGIPDHSSWAIHPDIDTWDVMFTVNTGDTDVQTIRLQWRHANDPDGLWRDLGDLVSELGEGADLFDYEPNLDYEQDGVTHHVWRLHVENWPARLETGGRMVFRALATDAAGNTNALDATVNAQELTADGEGPTLYDWNDDSVTNQVEVGSTVHFEITAQDDYTDVVATQLQAQNFTDGGDWFVVAGDDSPTGMQIDTGAGVWVSEYDWTAPRWVVHDTVYKFRLVTWDSAWNESINDPPHDFTITVEDNQPPDNTKIVDILAKVNYTSEDGQAPDPSVDDHRVYDVWMDRNGDDEFEDGTDYLISEGANPGVDDAEGEYGIAMVGEECNTWPRWVGESFLNDPSVRNVVKVAREVTLVGRTWADDDGIDAGIATVSFWAVPVDAGGTPTGDPMLIGKDEIAPFFPLYYWNVSWNTLELDLNGDRIWPDGAYKLTASAVDQEGNEEDLSSLILTSAMIWVDNEAPEAVMDADPATATLEKTLTVERNGWFTLFSRTLRPGTATEQTTEDDTVEWWYKRSNDLNVAGSWALVPGSAGVTPEDGNPDETRPYSFDVRPGLLTEPTDPVNNPPLAVGGWYDFVMDVGDEVCNSTDHLTAYADSVVTGVGARHLKVKIVDTIAPHLEITQAVRALPVRDGVTYGDGDPINNPTQVHAQGFESITASLLTGDRDVEYAEFVYRKMGETNWSLIDADLTMDDSEDGVVWTLGPWDLQTLEHATWYEVAAIGVDNVGNVDQNPDIMRVYVDFDAPPFALIHPAPETSFWCDYDYTAQGRILDLIAQVDRGVGEINDDVYDVVWEWKLASADSTQWSQDGVASWDELYDDTLNYYSNTLNLNALDTTEGGDAQFADLYDLRVTLVDEAGNIDRTWVWKNTVDAMDPNYVQISNVQWDGSDTTEDPTDQGQYTDITAGTLVEVFGTASDDEPNLPNERDPQTDRWYETGIAAMQFQVSLDLFDDGDLNDGEEWRDLGTYNFNPDDLGDLSAQTASVLWNTTGLPEGGYFLRVGVVDECGNGFTWSDPVDVRVVDNTPPIARIASWDADQQPHGDNPPSLVTVYALAESDPDIVDVQFQYNIVDAGETTPAGDWVNFGVPWPVTEADDYTTEVLWASTIDPTAFDPSVTQLWMRALVLDSSGNRYGDLPGDVVPTIQVNLVRDSDGTMTFEPVPAANLQNGSQMVQNVSVEIESPTVMIVTVDMASADQTPRVIRLCEANNPQVYPSPDNPVNYSPGTPWGLHRSLDDPTVWRGAIQRSGDEACLNCKVCVTALDGTAGTAQWVDMDGVEVHEYDVSYELGTNGTVHADAYTNLYTEVTVPSGAWDADDACMLVSPTVPPNISHEQSLYLTPVENTAYHYEVFPGGSPFVHGYEPQVVIKYSDDFAAMALEGSDATEADLTVRRWNPDQPNRDGTDGAWVGTGIMHIQVDPDANTVSFRVTNLTAAEVGDLTGDEVNGATGNVFQLFAPQSNAPVFFASVWPMSPYVSDWWTDADPWMEIYLKDPGGQVISPYDVELLIDGELWASWYLGEGSADWIRGNGDAILKYANGTQTVMVLSYDHSTYPRDWLTDGQHQLTVRYLLENGTDDWMEGTQNFYVDRTSPSIEFDGGFVRNPRLVNLAGYMNPANDSLMVKLYDGGSGILFKHDRVWWVEDENCNGVIDGDEYFGRAVPQPWENDTRCWLRLDWGVKYDLWLVNGEDNQNDIDQIEQRTLLHQGTADELAPWVKPSLESYNPAQDTLQVPVPVLGGGEIKDGDVVEVTWYSEKAIEENGDGPGLSCSIDTLMVNDQTILVYGADCTYDSWAQEMHIYKQGIVDWAANSGSAYVEQRFIVDMKPPDCTFSSPAATVDPSGDLVIDVTFSDSGAGLDESSISVVVLDPEGNEVEVEDLTIENGHITGVVHGPLMRGEYTVKVSANDQLGNPCTITRTVKSQSEFLTMSDAHAFPNPFNPAEGNAQIKFNLTRPATVTFSMYDYGGNEIQVLNWKVAGVVGNNQWEWSGQAADGTDLANGAYICRVEATDGRRKEAQNVKVVIWRE